MTDDDVPNDAQILELRACWAALTAGGNLDPWLSHEQQAHVAWALRAATQCIPFSRPPAIGDVLLNPTRIVKQVDREARVFATEPLEAPDGAWRAAPIEKGWTETGEWGRSNTIPGPPSALGHAITRAVEQFEASDPSEACPHCGANLIGEAIPENRRHMFGNATHYSRLFAHCDEATDRCEYYECPDCHGRIER